MAGRRTNLALLAFLAVAVATGSLAYSIGTGWVRVVLIAHGVAGLAIVALAPWKSVIARRGIRRRGPRSVPSVILSVLVGVAVLFGVLHGTGAAVSLGPVTAMQLHVGAALIAIPFAVWHVAARRVRVRRTDFSRRALLRAGVVVGGSALVYGVLQVLPIPGRDRRFTGSYVAGSFRPEEMPVTQWLNDRVPSIDPSTWQVVVTSGDTQRTWTYEELAEFDDRLRAVIDCTGGWYSEQDWSGVRLSRLLPRPVLARSIEVASATGYGRRLPAGDADRLLLATRVGGRPLSSGHGFPARIVAPGRRGFWWVKWVTAIRTTDTPWWWQLPFPIT
jgi:DMSO/TMAO reductase YedYZ molybdopterin-dependent catalytic subunit